MTNIQNYWQKLADDIKFRPIYWITMLLAILGAYWSSDPLAIWRGAGFSVWLFSNGYLLVHFYKDKNVPMVILFILYEIFNLRGVYSNWY